MDAEAISDIFQTFGPVQIRRMFGGQGIYREGVMFALADEGELFLKVDDDSVGHFRQLGSRPFSFQTKDGRMTITSFWLMPESALDDPDEAAELARMALRAALRAKASKGAKTKKSAPLRKARKSTAETA
ncbi:TfoX/Sxy family protein [Microvirga solisilvae]|uniref:TfoX/Sxy family protein n=1 Tax=Microvirga solisilvae TaxID=2919498 RepID=UPI001FAF6375|nr:TfoX/Sxy family protein [Microvirga solisilvae]